MHLFRLAVLSLLVASASSLVVASRKESEDETIDRFAQVKIKPVAAYVASGLIVGAATGVQVATPEWMRSTLGSACDSGIGAWALGCVETLSTMKKTNPLGLTLGHGVITKACADLLAQTIPAHSMGVAWIDPLRVFRSMLASVLSTSIPFYYWTRFLARRMAVAPEWLTGIVGKSGFGMALFKTIVTQAAFRPGNVLLFLALQSIFRGDTARQLVSMMNSKAVSSIKGGILFYSVSNMLMYSVPVPFLHPIMGSVAGLIFNTWLAVVAYKKK